MLYYIVISLQSNMLISVLCSDAEGTKDAVSCVAAGRGRALRTHHRGEQSVLGELALPRPEHRGEHAGEWR